MKRYGPVVTRARASTVIENDRRNVHIPQTVKAVEAVIHQHAMRRYVRFFMIQVAGGEHSRAKGIMLPTSGMITSRIPWDRSTGSVRTRNAVMRTK
jgi:hypothetical protein